MVHELYVMFLVTSCSRFDQYSQDRLGEEFRVAALWRLLEETPSTVSTVLSRADCATISSDSYPRSIPDARHHAASANQVRRTCPSVSILTLDAFSVLDLIRIFVSMEAATILDVVYGMDIQRDGVSYFAVVRDAMHVLSEVANGSFIGGSFIPCIQVLSVTVFF